MLKNIDWFSLNPDKGLEKQGVFWVALGIPILLSILLWTPLWSEYSFSFTKDGYDTFLSISKLPLTICSLAIPFSVLVARIHGTKQTAKQIANTEKQIANAEQDNKTKLYLSHYSHFCEHVESVEKTHFQLIKGYVTDDKDKIITRKMLYHALYPGANLTNGISAFSSAHFEICEQFLEEYLNKITEIFKIERESTLHRDKRKLQGEIVIELTRSISEYEKKFTFDSTKCSIFKWSISYLRDQDLIYKNFSTYLYLVVYFANLTIDFLLLEPSENTQEQAPKLQILIDKFKSLINDESYVKYCKAHEKYLLLSADEREAEAEYEAQLREAQDNY